jgi:transcriptional regulator with PAS, ATPase and Fis domain
MDDFDSRTGTDVRGPVSALREPLPPVLVSVFDAAPCFRPIAVRTSARLGREGAEIVLADSKVSRLHAELRMRQSSLVISDLGSRNGTWRNGVQVTDAVELVAGDVVRMGRSLAVCARWDEPARPGVDYTAGPLIGGPALDRARQAVAVAAGDSRSVLVLGATGTGKELIARLAHTTSGREGDFVPVNCAALPDALVESELFGHVKGAFSGSHDSRRGLVRQAHRGTLFLDEIGELPPAAQAVLLRVLEEGKVRPVGGDVSTPVDLRVVAATHRNLNDMMQEGRFRVDLFHRLAVHVVSLPALDQRPEDIVALSQHLLAGKNASVSVDAFEILLGARFEGNVRGLRNALDHAAATALRAGRTVIEPTDLPALPTRFGPTEPATGAERRTELESALKEASGNVAKAARLLGIHRSTLYAELLRHRLDATAYRKR